MEYYCKRCETDQHKAEISLFLLKNRRDFHPSFTVQDMVSLTYSYMTEGHVICTVDEQDQVLGVCAYYIGTREQEFKDKERAFLDLGLSARSVRGTRVFIQGLVYLVDQLAEQHPDVEEVCFNARSDNRYLTRMYAKFARVTGTKEGPRGEETRFAEKLPVMRAKLEKFRRFS